MNTHGATVNRGEIVSMYAGLKGVVYNSFFMCCGNTCFSLFNTPILFLKFCLKCCLSASSNRV